MRGLIHLYFDMLSHQMYPFILEIIHRPIRLLISLMPTRILHGSILMSYHHKLMPFAWSLFIDAAIFAAIFSHKPYFLSLHVVGAVLVGGASIVTSFQSFLKGIPTEPGMMRTHKMVGVSLYILITLQLSIGILGWVMRSS